MPPRLFACAAALFAALGAYLLASAPAARHVAAPAAVTVPQALQAPGDEDGIRVLFSPSGGCTDAIIAGINGARRTLDVQAYTFTAGPIARAVADAHARGVRVRVIFDKGQSADRACAASVLSEHGVPVWVDGRHAIAHNKVILIDGRVLLTGSFNFTRAAEDKNAKNLLVIRDKPKLIQAYQENFEHHLDHSTPLARGR